MVLIGPRIDLAIALIDRMKKLFSSSSKSKALAITTTTFNTKETVIDLNGVKIEAFPSHHLDAMRGLPNVSFILLDEADFFPPGQQQDARDVSERYIAKSNPYIVMVSTPNAPEGLFERIEKESEDTCLYKRIFLDYTYGVGKIYTAEEIEKAKQSPSFEREYSIYHFTTITGHDACVMTPDATLPSNSFLNSDLPLLPVTIRSTSLFLAYSTIAETIDVAVTTTSV
jgi:hypothetical protein